MERITRQYAEVLCAGAGKARIGRQYVEVLGTVSLSSVSVDATDTLDLTDVGVGVRGATGEATDTLVLSDAADAEHILAASDLLTLIDNAIGSNNHQFVSDLLELNEAVGLLGVYNLSSADTLELTDGATVLSPRVDASDILTLHDKANLARDFRALSSLVLHDKADYRGPRLLSASDLLQRTGYRVDPTGAVVTYPIGLSDFASAALIPATPRTASHRLSLRERAVGIVIRADAIPATASDTLTLTDMAARNQLLGATSRLVLTNLATAVVTKVIRETLVLHESATVKQVLNLSASDLLTLHDALAYVTRPESVQWQYHPLIGSGFAGQPTPPASSLAGPVSGIGSVRFVWPAAAPTDSMVLRSPEFGNKDRLTFTRISRETRGGTLIVFADPYSTCVRSFKFVYFDFV